MTTTVKGCVSFWKNVIVLRLAVVEDRELILFEVRDQPSLRVEHRGRDRDNLRGRLEGRAFLLGGKRQCGGGEKRDGRKGPHEISLSDLQTRAGAAGRSMISRMRSCLHCRRPPDFTGLLVAGAAAAAQAQDVAARASATAPSPFASWTIAGRSRIQARRPQAEQAIYDGRKAALDAIIADMLVAAGRQGEGRHAGSVRAGRNRASGSSR